MKQLLFNTLVSKIICSVGKITGCRREGQEDGISAQMMWHLGRWMNEWLWVVGKRLALLGWLMNWANARNSVDGGSGILLPVKWAFLAVVWLDDDWLAIVGINGLAAQQQHATDRPQTGKCVPSGGEREEGGRKKWRRQMANVPPSALLFEMNIFWACSRLPLHIEKLLFGSQYRWYYNRDLC